MRRFFVAVVSLFCSGIVSAQQGPEATVKALILSPGEREMSISFLAQQSQLLSKSVMIGNLGLSDPVTVAERKLSIVIPDKAKESGFRPIGDISLPATGSDFIVLLEPADGKFMTHVVSGKLPGFGRGDTLFFNATDMSLGATLGERKIIIPPRKPVAGGPPAKGSQSWYQVTFYQPVEGGSSRKFGDTRWSYRDHARAYVFFYPDGPFNGVSYHVVDEMLGETPD